MTPWTNSAARRDLTSRQRVQWCAVRWGRPRTPDDDGQRHGICDDIERMIEEHAAEAVRKDREKR